MHTCFSYRRILRSDAKHTSGDANLGKTAVQNLVRHAESGRYYALLFSGGKEVWKSLKTAHFSVAKARLTQFIQEYLEKQAPAITDASAKMTLGEALKLQKQRLADDVTIPTTRHYWSQIFACLLKNWPGLEEREILRRQLFPERCVGI